MLRIVAALLAIALFVGGGVFGGTYGGGSGTAEDPYRIADANDFLELCLKSEDYGMHFTLTADIDLAGYSFSMAPIAPDAGPIDGEFFEGTAFTGTFDGGGHVISSVTIEDEVGRDFVGLFGYTEGASIRNLELRNLVVHATGYDFQSVWRGGLVGLQVGGEIAYCRCSSRIEGGRYGIGGLVGRLSGGTIRNCRVTTDIRIGQWGSACIGGLVGWSDRGTILNCASEGSLVQGTNNTNMGGLAGLLADGDVVRNCYSQCSVTGDDNIGGLVGHQFASNGIIEACYSTGTVAGHEETGGLVGNNKGTVRASFWDRQTSEQYWYSAGGAALFTWEMRSLSTFTSAGWGFVGEEGNGVEDVWRMCGDGVSYPRLSWEYSRVGDFACGDGVEMEDLVYLCERWLCADEAAGAADGDGDGVVGMGDFALVAENWR